MVSSLRASHLTIVVHPCFFCHLSIDCWAKSWIRLVNFLVPSANVTLLVVKRWTHLFYSIVYHVCWKVHWPYQSKTINSWAMVGMFICCFQNCKRAGTWLLVYRELRRRWFGGKDVEGSRHTTLHWACSCQDAISQASWVGGVGFEWDDLHSWHGTPPSSS